MRRPPRYVSRLPTCERKFIYRDVAEALAAALLFPAADRVGLEAYLCPRCGAIHLGHRRS